MAVLNCSRSKFALRGIYKEFASEFLGTFVLVLIIIGIGSQVVLSSGSAGESLTDCLGTGFAVMMAVSISGKISGAHVNPVMSLALAWVNKFPWRKVPVYMLAQYAGAFVAAGIAYLVYKDALFAFQRDPHSMDTAAIYTTFPAPFLQLWNGFVDATTSSALLVILNLAVCDRKNMELQSNYSPLILGLVVSGIKTGFNYNDGNPMNPARDFSPRLFLLAAGWGTKVFYGDNYAWWWVPLVAPHVGAIIGGTVYVLFIEIHHPSDDEDFDLKDSELEPVNGQLLTEGRY